MSSSVRTGLVVALMVVSVMWHLGWVLGSAWPTALSSKHARDFASYYYAVQVAFDGGNPYSKKELGKAAIVERTRKQVHPFFYPPPFLLAFAWTLPFSLYRSYLAWFWLDELCVWACVLILWRWWRPMGESVGWMLFVAVAALTAIPNNHQMGQVNLPVMVMVLGALALADRRPWAAGVLLGVACLFKMSPALFVALALLQGRYKVVLASILTGAALLVASTLVLGIDVPQHFFLQVLPGFGTGDYNDLTVPINMFGNHSIPNLWNQLWPGARNQGLSTTGLVGSAVCALVLVGALGAWLWRAPSDAFGQAAQFCAVSLAMLIIPVYTYEHHLVWGLPAVVLTALAVSSGRLGPGWWALLGFAWIGWAFDLDLLQEWYSTLKGQQTWLAWLLQEWKFFSLVVLLAASAWLARPAGWGKS